jgi:hypothetical protein
LFPLPSRVIGIIIHEFKHFTESLDDTVSCAIRLGDLRSDFVSRSFALIRQIWTSRDSPLTSREFNKEESYSERINSPEADIPGGKNRKSGLRSWLHPDLTGVRLESGDGEARILRGWFKQMA